MKSNDRDDIYADDMHNPRETRHKTEILYKNINDNATDDIEPFDMFITEDSPALPSEGETIAFAWVEDEEGNEVMEYIPETEIGSDGLYTHVQSTKFIVNTKTTTYYKQQLETNNGKTKRIMTIKHVLTITEPHNAV